MMATMKTFLLMGTSSIVLIDKMEFGSVELLELCLQLCPVWKLSKVMAVLIDHLESELMRV